MKAALRRKLEPPPRSMKTRIAISMIEKIANIPTVIRGDDMEWFSCALEDSLGLSTFQINVGCCCCAAARILCSANATGSKQCSCSLESVD